MKDRHVPAGHVADYVSPYGRVCGLAQRLVAFGRKLRQPGAHLPYYGGLIADLEVVVRFLNLREYAEWLVVHGDDEQRDYAKEMLDALDNADAAEGVYDDIERVLPVAEGQPYAEAVAAAARKAAQFDAVRAVLEQAGALSPRDAGTDVPALIRALLS